MANIQLSSDASKAYIDYAASVINSEVQTMTSLQIAEVTGKQHAHVMRDIRNMVEAMKKSNQSTSGLVEEEYHRGDRTQYKYLSDGTQKVLCDFAFGSKASQYLITEASYVDAKGEARAMYNLNKKACLLLASGYDVVLRAKIIDRWELLETERAVSTPNNPQLQFIQAQFYVADALSQRLRLNEASRLGMYQSIAEPYRLAVPQYVESKGVTKALKDLLADMHSPYSAIKFNQMLEAQGYIETKTRPSSGGMVKRFKSITDKGLAYGENLQSPRNQKETQPHWYADRFNELYNIITA